MFFPQQSIHFRKFQSIGNDFVLIDLHHYQEGEVQKVLQSLSSEEIIKYIGKRRTGIGADGILIITKAYNKNKVDVLVYNADGTRAKNCLNGVRTIAHYLYAYCSFEAEITVCIGVNRYVCKVTKVYPEEKKADVTTWVTGSKIIRQLKVMVGEKEFEGWYTMVGNPHFVICQPVETSWLEKHGQEFQQLAQFPEGVNVEFITQNATGGYTMVVYERGCGITHGCSSGIAAATRVLKENKQIGASQPLVITMQGGDVAVSVDQHDTILLQASSHFVFKGTF